MKYEDKTIENLLELDGLRYLIDGYQGLWVKFEAKKVAQTKERPHGVRYSLSLHNRFNERMMGFDNAHQIEHGGKNKVAPKRVYDHWHKHSADEGRPYLYRNAGKLIEDFWVEVDKILKKIEDKK